MDGPLVLLHYNPVYDNMMLVDEKVIMEGCSTSCLKA